MHRKFALLFCMVLLFGVHNVNAECSSKLCKKDEKSCKHDKSKTDCAAKKCDGSKDLCTRPKQETTPGFELLKSLQGTWRGTTEMDGKKMPITLQYRVISGGTAVMETIFPGQPMEMISVYVVRDGKIEMTHYCSLGNQPRLIEKSSAADEVSLSFVKTPGINAKKDMYMAGLTIKKIDAKRMQQTWLALSGKKPKHSGTTDFTRIK